MKKAFAVIGANYGDEGKGLMTDFLCNEYRADLVVRFNGGAQAGHTVVTPDGRRHVFGHFGSGSFLGVPTYLTEHFVVNPLLFMKEYDKLIELLRPRRTVVSVIVDPNCRMTTPYDILVNQMVEQKRGAKRHGSVGVGFGETIGRHSKFPLSYSDTVKIANFRDRVQDIRFKWFPKRCEELGIDEKLVYGVVHNGDIFKNFISDSYSMKALCLMGGIERILSASTVVFEGAQGLGLDMDHGVFPYVTRSNTGLTNLGYIWQRANLRDLEVIYMTRSYLTRHGAGPLKGELGFRPYDRIVDDTNLPHDFQGSLRFAYLDVDGLRDRINRDIDSNLIPIKTKLCVTCMDQMGSEGILVKHGQRQSYDPNLFVQAVNSFVGFDEPPMYSVGRTRMDIKILK